MKQIIDQNQTMTIREIAKELNWITEKFKEFNTTWEKYVHASPR